MNAQGAIFQLNTDGHSVMHTLGPGWTDTSILSCLLRCLQIYQSCYSVMFYEDSKYCSPGSSLVAATAQSGLRTGTIYHNVRLCDAEMEYTWYRSNDVGVCLWESTEQLNYVDARKSCAAKGGNLYTMKVKEKLDILRDAFSETVGMYWIGLDDLKVKDSFRWVDDETIITPGLRQLLFGTSPTARGSTGSNCIKYTAGLNSFAGDTCTTLYNYVCEMKK